MELVEGETLEAIVRREGPMPIARALEVIEQTARALAAAEACGVVHRDIKPSNIMLESDPGGTPIAKVIDYGVAKVLAPDAQLGDFQTQTGFIGTPAFASPEQFGPSEQRQIDPRSDIYSLGVTFWYLLVVACLLLDAPSKKFARDKHSSYQWNSSRVSTFRHDALPFSSRCWLRIRKIARNRRVNYFPKSIGAIQNSAPKHVRAGRG